MTARYRAPAADGGLLADPPPDRIGDQLDANAARLTSSPLRIAGVPLPEFRRAAAREITVAARQYLAESGEPAPPSGTALLAAGHQPELYHPGVWVKNFALHRLAGRHGRAPLNLVVDNDTVKAAAVRVPVLADRPEQVEAVPVPFDGPAGELPYEEYCVRDPEQFRTFPDRLAARVRGWGFEPLAFAVWPALRAEVERGAPFGEAVSRVRRGLERRWGVANFELPVSRLACTRAFAGFVHAVLADLPRFADGYNAALRAYRQANRLRSRNHPAPDLERRGDWVEAPFWAWRADAPRRVKLFARRAEGGLELQAEDRPIGRVPADPAGFTSCCRDMTADGWKFRPRALTLTLFVRLCLADGFIHGIGGGKYDEVTDEIIRRAFGLEPPGFAVVSATLRLPVHRFPSTEADLRAAERAVRDREWNPQRFPEVRARFPELVAEKERAVAPEPVGKAARRDWFRHLQQLTRDLRPAVVGGLSAAEERLTRARAELTANGILESREYAWPLFPERMLREFFTRLT